MSKQYEVTIEAKSDDGEESVEETATLNSMAEVQAFIAQRVKVTEVSRKPVGLPRTKRGEG